MCPFNVCVTYRGARIEELADTHASHGERANDGRPCVVSGPCSPARCDGEQDKSSEACRTADPSQAGVSVNATVMGWDTFWHTGR